MAMRQTHTYAILRVSPETYREIREKLARAGYEHTFQQEDDGEVIDLHGVALQAEGDGGSEDDESLSRS